MKLSLTLLSSLCMSLVYADTIPEVATGEAQFSTLVAALTAADLVGTLSTDGPFTVFAPTNDAFDALGDVVTQLLLPCNSAALTSILTYHVANGKVESGDLSNGQIVTTLESSTVEVTIDANGGVKINESVVSTADIPASNGVIHEIDAVLVPSTVDVSALLTTCPNIPEVATGAAQFSTLVAALTAADLVDTLSADGPFTVFAPTNDAFDALGDVVTNLLLPCNSAALTSVLTYHVVSGKVEAGDLSNGQTPETLEGSTVDVTIDDSGVKINTSTVTTADIPASNGVIHEIDAVLVPSSVDPSALLTECPSESESESDDSAANMSSIVMPLALATVASMLV